jgi:hypothetical protein
MDKMKVIALKKTSVACPSQWEGKFDNGKIIYIRYRWGCFKISIGDSLYDAVSNSPMYEEFIGDQYDGHMENKDLIKILDNIGIQVHQSVKLKMLDDSTEIDEPSLLDRMLNLFFIFYGMFYGWLMDFIEKLIYRKK